MEQLAAADDITVQWRSFELRPIDAPPPPPEYRERIMAGRPRLYAIAREHYGLELNQGPWGINSRPALIGAKYAEAQGVGPAYHAAIMHAYWQAAHNIEEMDVLGEVATSVGLDPEAFEAALTNADWEQAVLNDIAWAHTNGISGVPALVFEQKYLVSGAQPYPVLTQILQQVRTQE